MGLYLDGRRRAVVGTHTHVVTGDERILPGRHRLPDRPRDDRPDLERDRVRPEDRPAAVHQRPADPVRGRRGAGDLQCRPGGHRSGHRPGARDRADPAAPTKLDGAAAATAPRIASGRPGGPAGAVHDRSPHPHGPLGRPARAGGARRAPPRRRAFGSSRSPTTTPWPAYREVVAAGARPGRARAHPGDRDQRDRRRRPDLHETRCTSWGSGSTRTTTALESTLALQRTRRRVRFERMVARLRELGLADRRRARGAAGDRRRRCARPADGRPGDDREGLRASVEDAFERYLSRGRPALRAARGPRSHRGDPTRSGRRRPRRPRALLRGAGAPGRHPRAEGGRPRRPGGLLPDLRRADGRRGPAASRTRPRSSRRAAPTTMATSNRTPRRTPSLWVPPGGGGAAPGGPAGSRDSSMIERPPGRRPRASRPRDRAARAVRRRVTPGIPTTPAWASSGRSPGPSRRFYVWTLGCQMNRSDSEEMAGRLLAAGATEARRWNRPTSSSSTPAPSANSPRPRSSAARATCSA